MDTLSYLLGKKNAGGGGSGGQDLDWSALGYSQRPNSIDTGYNFALVIQKQFEDVANLYNKYYSNRQVVFFPKVKVTKATTTERMFVDCNCLMYGDFSDWNTSNVTTMSEMFRSCYSLIELDLSTFTTEALTNTSSMFRGCSKLKKLDISKMDFSNVTTFTQMFSSLPADCQIIVKDATAQNWVLTANNGHYTNWTTDNVIIKS